MVEAFPEAFLVAAFQSGVSFQRQRPDAQSGQDLRGEEKIAPDQGLLAPREKLVARHLRAHGRGLVNQSAVEKLVGERFQRLLEFFALQGLFHFADLGEGELAAAVLPFHLRDVLKNAHGFPSEVGIGDGVHEMLEFRDSDAGAFRLDGLGRIDLAFEGVELLGQNRGAQGAHDGMEFRDDDVAAGDLFQIIGHGPVVGHAALEDDVAVVIQEEFADA